MTGMWDYIVLTAVIGFVSIYGLTKAKVSQKQTATEVLIGSKVSVATTALSVCSGFISSISLLGFPAEIYYFGAGIMWYSVVYMIGFPLVAYLFLPVMYRLKLTSIYTYLELRFNVTCRCIGAFLFSLQTLLYIGVSLYAPSLAISAILNLPVEFVCVVTAILSSIYISVGGARAGMYTQALQMLIIFVCMVAIIIASLFQNSLIDVFVKAYEGRRLNIFDFRIDPRIRNSVFALVIGGTGNILCLFAANQLSMQKYMAMSTLGEAQRVVMLNIPCNMFILFTYGFVGLLLYSTYANCDPVVESKDALLPLYVMEYLQHVPGFTGLFLAAVYSAGISTLSSAFSALSAVFVEDVVKTVKRQFGNSELSDSTQITITRWLPFVFAFMSIGIAILCKEAGSAVLQIAFSVFGAVGGPVLGAFIIGIFFPYVKGRAACVGLVLSTCICLFIAFGAMFAQVHPVRHAMDRSCPGTNKTAIYQLTMGEFKDIKATLQSVEGLMYPVDNDDLLIDIFKISYQYYSIIGVLVNVAVSFLFQAILGEKKEISGRLLFSYTASNVFDVVEEVHEFEDVHEDVEFNEMEEYSEYGLEHSKNSLFDEIDCLDY